MPRATPGIEARKFLRRLRQLGFVELRRTGGHVIMKAPTGAQVSCTAERSKTKPTFNEVKRCADAAGVSIDELLYGRTS